MAFVEVGDIDSKVTLDSDSQTIEKIVRIVLQAVEDRDAHRQRIRAEQRITRGVSYELEESE